MQHDIDEPFDILRTWYMDAVIISEYNYYVDDEVIRKLSGILVLHILATYLYIVYLYDIVFELVSETWLHKINLLPWKTNNDII